MPNNEQKYRLIIFGGTGDLSRKKLIPSLFALYQLNLLPKNIVIVSVGSRDISGADYRKLVSENISKKNTLWQKFSKQLKYQQCDITQCDQFEKENMFLNDKSYLNIFYLALAPNMHHFVLEQLKHKKGSKDRIVIEKPFGYDQKSAKKLNDLVAKVFGEKQIYRIDHYLAKETVQNILAFRFSNGIFEPAWNSKFIDSVQIEAMETIGIELRARYFDKIGIVRDMIQSHLLQLLAVIAMELPKDFSADAIRDQKVAIFKAIKKVSPAKIKGAYIKGQYDGYKDEKDIPKNSKTPTFAAMKLFIDKKRWQGVPFYLRTGKKMGRAYARIIVNFKLPSVLLFGQQQNSCGMQNQLVIDIQPEEKISIRFGAKKPGSGMGLLPVNMTFAYKEAFRQETVPAYARLLYDLLSGEQSLFARKDGVEESWSVIDNYEAAWQKGSKKVFSYKPGSFGPDTSAIFKGEGECHNWPIY